MKAGAFDLNSYKLATLRDIIYIGRQMAHRIQDVKSPSQGDLQQIIVGTICIILTVLLATSFARKRGADKRKLQLPPGPKGWPILGALPLLGGRKHETLHKLSTKHGPLMFMRLGSVPAVVVSNAKMAEEILKTNDRDMASRPDFMIYTSLFYNRQDVAFAPYGSYWREIRKICTLKLLTASRINQFQDKRRNEVKRMVRSMLEEAQKGNTIRINHFFEKLTMNIVTQMMWNKSHRTYGSVPTDEKEGVFVDFFKEVSSLMGMDNIGDFLPGLNWLSTSLQGFNKRMAVVHKKIDDFIEEILREHKQRRPVSTVAAETIPSDADDFVDVLLNHGMDTEAGQSLCEDSVKGILMDMIVAGTETTANNLEWALAELVRHPHIMKRVQDELSSVVGPDRLVNEEDVPKLTYLNAVMREAMRLHPPVAAGVPRASTADCKIGGFHVPTNSLIFINLWAIHRDPEVWERPLQFDPQRFLEQRASAGVDWKGMDFQLLPFGAGRRICPGITLASSVLHLALAQVLHCVEWRLPEGQRPEDVDMTESFGFQCTKEVPLILVAKPRLSTGVL